MSTYTLMAAFLGFWIVTGLVSGVWMVRRGHDPLWVVIAVVLGPLFAPIALERAERNSRRALSDSSPAHRPKSPGQKRALVALDGSPESDEALMTAVALFGSNCWTFLLVEVVHYEMAETPDHAELDAVAGRLAMSVARIEKHGVPASFDVLAGPPGKTLRQVAEQHNVDLIVVGRRGQGLTTHIMGSVSADLVQHSTVPVLVGRPASKAANTVG